MDVHCCSGKCALLVILAQGDLQLPIISVAHGVALLAWFLPQKHFVTHPFVELDGGEWDVLSVGTA